MGFFADNWQMIFGGLGTTVVGAIVGAWAKKLFASRSGKTDNSSDVRQKAKAGEHSTISQAGRDIKL